MKVQLSQYLKNITANSSESAWEQGACNHLVVLFPFHAEPLSQLSISSSACILYQHGPSSMTAVGVQVHCSNFTGIQKPEMNYSCIGTMNVYLQPCHPVDPGSVVGYFCCWTSVHSSLVISTCSANQIYLFPKRPHTSPTFPAWQSYTSPHLAASGAAQLFQVKDGELGA